MVKIQAQEALQAATIASLPHMEGEARKLILDSYRQQASDIIEQLQQDDDFSNLSRLNKML